MQVKACLKVSETLTISIPSKGQHCDAFKSFFLFCCLHQAETNDFVAKSTTSPFTLDKPLTNRLFKSEQLLLSLASYFVTSHRNHSLIFNLV